MRELVLAVRQSVANRNWYSALATTLTLDDPPDVVHVWIEPNSFDAMIEGITMMCRFFTINGWIRRS